MFKILLSLFLFFSISSFCQKSYNGIITYESKKNSDDFKKLALSDPKMDPTMRKFIEDKMNKMFNKTFILQFDNYNSVYKEDTKLDLNSNESNQSWSPDGIEVAYFKNLKTKTYIVQQDLMGKDFYVKDSLVKLDWKLESETKKIGAYLCYKATVLLPVSKQEQIDYEIEKAEQEKASTQLFELKEPKPKLVTAWYTTEIPINQGPEKFWGLPGLILELSDDKTVILCSKVVLNSKENSTTKLPKKAKIITKTQFAKLIEKKNKELENVDFTKQ
ncbi:GLPGLI family protein [Flavobacterium sp.]|uniref:GLPGLI family protein n=1 Tax=Flavobacterium sp. TaxID=239 RepID=UPI003750AA8D